MRVWGLEHALGLYSLETGILKFTHRLSESRVDKDSGFRLAMVQGSEIRACGEGLALLMNIQCSKQDLEIGVES